MKSWNAETYGHQTKAEEDDGDSTPQSLTDDDSSQELYLENVAFGSLTL